MATQKNSSYVMETKATKYRRLETFRRRIELMIKILKKQQVKYFGRIKRCMTVTKAVLEGELKVEVDNYTDSKLISRDSRKVFCQVKRQNVEDLLQLNFG